MTMPIDLVLVRHGQSEGNLANRRSQNGDHSAFTPEFLKRHSSTYRLTKEGRQQAGLTGAWIRHNIGDKFDRYYASEYIRAQETAALLNLSDANWYLDFFLRERDRGQLDVMSDKFRRENHADELIRQKRDGFYWSPPGGESIAHICLRIDRVISTLHRECSNMRVIIVCHSEVMWAFRVRLERITQARYTELDNSYHSHDHIHGGQVIHYTRRRNDDNPKDLAPHLYRMKSVWPDNKNKSQNRWIKLNNQAFTNEQILEEISRTPIMVDNK